MSKTCLILISFFGESKLNRSLNGLREQAVFYFLYVMLLV